MLTLLLITLFAQAVATSPPAGRWDSDARSRGGLGSWRELAKDGTCTQTTGAMVDGTWKLDGEQLAITMGAEVSPVIA